MLKVRGVSYLADEIDEQHLHRDLGLIARELACNAVMLIGRDPVRLVDTARPALDLGLDVYVRPDATDLSPTDMLDRLASVAEQAERLRIEYAGRVTLIVGSEFSHTVSGIVPGPRSFIRLRLILRSHRLLRRRINRRLAALLDRAAARARQHFGGPVTYAAAGWEDVDWSAFDLVGVSLYRSARNHDRYRARVTTLATAHGKPFLVTEFGCGAFTGADARGAGSFQIVDWFTTPPRIRGDHPRDETVQARYLAELIDLYADEGVHGCFVFTFAMPGFCLDRDPSRDLDRAGFGLVAEQDGGLRRKAAFHAVADRYRSLP